MSNRTVYKFVPDIHLQIKNNHHQVVKFGSCLNILDEIKEGSITIIVTSPPYDLNKSYGKYVDTVGIERWKTLISETTQKVYKALKPNGSFFLNVSPIPDPKTKEIIPLGSIAYDIIKQNGFYLRNMIVWNFNNMVNCVNRLSGRYENILWCVKDINNYIFNLDDIRIPYITKKDKRLDPSGGRNPTDSWYFDRVNNMTKKKFNIQHPTVYPTPMIERIVKMSSHENDWILDPFLGSGTTLIAAANNNRNGIGIELDEQYKSLIVRRLEVEVNLQGKFFNS
ncbi:DNA-methyltransferase [Chloroflexota bacterium]